MARVFFWKHKYPCHTHSSHCKTQTLTVTCKATCDQAPPSCHLFGHTWFFPVSSNPPSLFLPWDLLPTGPSVWNSFSGQSQGWLLLLCTSQLAWHLRWGFLSSRVDWIMVPSSLFPVRGLYVHTPARCVFSTTHCRQGNFSPLTSLTWFALVLKCGCKWQWARSELRP